MRAITGLSLALCVAMSGCGSPLSSSPKPTPEPKPQPTPSIPKPQLLERVEATPDTVGTRGKGYGGGIITEPIRQRFRLEDKLLLLQVQHALQLYNALNGRYPKSHEEFMRDVVNSPMYQFKLPDLPPGQKYVYDPETRKLMVERPVQK